MESMGKVSGWATEGMALVPMAGNIRPAADPNPLVTLYVVTESGQGCNAPGSGDQTAV
jgi:hypothetical protein